MASEPHDDDRIDRLIDEVRKLAYRVEEQSTQRAKDPTWWDRATKTAGAFLLAVSLTLGVSHEVQHSPAPHMPAVSVVQQMTPMQRSSVEQLVADAARLADWTKSPGNLDSLSEIRDAVSKDLQSIIKYPCAESVEAEAVELLLQLQLDSTQKVASEQRVTSTEHRVKRLASVLKSLCG